MAVLKSIGTRVAGPADAACVAELLNAADADRAGRRGATAWLAESRHDVSERAVQGLLAQDFVVVGEIKSVPVGVLVAHVTRSEGRVTIKELFTTPHVRGVGVGAAMLRMLTSWASERGLQAIDASALPGDRSTKNFFEAHGLVTRRLVVSRDLS